MIGFGGNPGSDAVVIAMALMATSPEQLQGDDPRHRRIDAQAEPRDLKGQRGSAARYCSTSLARIYRLPSNDLRCAYQRRTPSQHPGRPFQDVPIRTGCQIRVNVGFWTADEIEKAAALSSGHPIVGFGP